MKIEALERRVFTVPASLEEDVRRELAKPEWERDHELLEELLGDMENGGCMTSIETVSVKEVK